MWEDVGVWEDVGRIRDRRLALPSSRTHYLFRFTSLIAVRVAHLRDPSGSNISATAVTQTGLRSDRQDAPCTTAHHTLPPAWTNGCPYRYATPPRARPLLAGRHRRRFPQALLAVTVSFTLPLRGYPPLTVLLVPRHVPQGVHHHHSVVDYDHHLWAACGTHLTHNISVVILTSHALLTFRAASM